MGKLEHHCKTIDERQNEYIFCIDETQRWIQCIEIKSSDKTYGNYSTISFCPYCGLKLSEQKKEN